MQIHKTLLSLCLFILLAGFTQAQHLEFDFNQLKNTTVLVQLPAQYKFSKAKYKGQVKNFEKEYEKRSPVKYQFISYEEWVGKEGGKSCTDEGHLGKFSDREKYPYVISANHQELSNYEFVLRDRREESCAVVFNFFEMVTETREVEKGVLYAEDTRDVPVSSMSVKSMLKLFREEMEKDGAIVGE